MPIDDKNLSEKICEACGERFSCGAEVGKCWCFEVEISPDKLTKLEKDFNNCLCQKCLIGDDEKSISKNI